MFCAFSFPDGKRACRQSRETGIFKAMVREDTW